MSHLLKHSRSALLTLLAASTVGLAAEQPRPYRLSRTDLAELANKVCVTRHGVPEDRIAAWQTPGEPPERPSNSQADAQPRTNGGPGSLRASVECKPHQVSADFAVFYAANCTRTAGWQCGRSEISVRADIERHPVIIHTRGYKPELAYSLVSKIADYRTQKGDPVLKPNTMQCSLAPGPAKDLLDVTCDERVIRLSYWCPKSTCPRIFSIDGYFVPADVGGL